MPKYENPARGVLLCPVCSSIATVHLCGEGQLIATGEPPKNSRNMGLKYYRCPECGNSPISKKVSEYVEAHEVSDKSELPTPNLTEPSTAIETETSATLTEDTHTENTNPDTASSAHVTESDDTPPKTTKGLKSVWKWGLILLAVFAVLAWVYHQLKPKKVTELPVNDSVTLDAEVEHG